MNNETINAIANRAAESVFIVRTEQEVHEMKQAMRKVAAIAIRDAEQISCHGLEYYQNKYLSTLDEGVEKQAVERAFEAVLTDFIKDK